MALTDEDLKAVLPDGVDSENPGKYQALLDDLQGNILRGHGRDFSIHLFLQFNAKTDRQKQLIKQWIAGFTTQCVTSANKQASDAKRYRQDGTSGGGFANFFLSMTGYSQLGFGYGATPNDQLFRTGMKDLQSLGVLADPSPRNPGFPFNRLWDKGFGDRIDALVLLADDDYDRLQQIADRLQQELRSLAKILRRESGFRLKNARGQTIEHFGFVDGVSQPLFLKRDIDKARTQDDNFDQWDPRAPLSLVVVKDPNGKTEDSYGSFLVYRKLEQDVRGFRQQQQQLASALGISVELAEAFTVGRFRDGTPVTLSDVPKAEPIANNFTYEADMEGTKCPFHAHIRKTNPRGDTSRFNPPDIPLEEEKGHRIARRGISYGENDPTAEPEKGSGLLFLCFQSNIVDQFGTMQTIWSNSAKFIKDRVGRDPIIGQGGDLPDGTNQHFWPKQWDQADFQAFNFTLWIRMKGGEYFFAPSISFLKSLCE